MKFPSMPSTPAAQKPASRPATAQGTGAATSGAPFDAPATGAAATTFGAQLRDALNRRPDGHGTETRTGTATPGRPTAPASPRPLGGPDAGSATDSATDSAVNPATDGAAGLAVAQPNPAGIVADPATLQFWAATGQTAGQRQDGTVAAGTEAPEPAPQRAVLDSVQSATSVVPAPAVAAGVAEPAALGVAAQDSAAPGAPDAGQHTPKAAGHPHPAAADPAEAMPAAPAPGIVQSLTTSDASQPPALTGGMPRVTADDTAAAGVVVSEAAGTTAPAAAVAPAIPAAARESGALAPPVTGVEGATRASEQPARGAGGGPGEAAAGKPTPVDPAITATPATPPAAAPAVQPAPAPLAAGPVTAAAPVPAPPLAEQLARPLFSLAGAPLGEHVMTVNVVPEGLGPVTVRAHLAADGIRIELLSATDAGRDSLRTLLPDLKRDLAAGGLATSLSLGAGSGGQDHGPGQQRSPAGQAFPWAAATGSEAVPAAEQRRAPAPVGANSSLDITV
ncbi:hypothetical protein AL755_00335 (plasmid) [Arthrobacter sp. ERGS1:01]|uniref:flagellar hook-length control protein FliK n=1 Tax=Arthrobacter sp. ERGS1:01 TaxID=1704044 RepID=UPI0006B5C455|nr:flagellar hook-length control protein FliK [Arthrobacter sp. ERGS1:01]ALE04206.1 hypothetical protein AL755_00335 [Arthrobacter sp. ERGS1:01]